MTDEEIPFGTWLRRERRRLDLTRQALAARAGCAEVTLRRIEAGTLKPSRELARILLGQLGIPDAELERWIAFARGQSGYPQQPIPPVATPAASNLPAFLTTFIGRDSETAEVRQLLDRQRLVTLTGAGGVGKTRLAVRIGEQALGQFPDGVWMAELASQTDPGLVPQALAATLGLTTMSKVPYPDLLVTFLRPRKTLLILDNCEHLLLACAQLAEMLLKACPDLKILATSREALKLMGEAVYLVPSLQIPSEQETLEEYRQFGALQLFEERARLVQPDFALTQENILFVLQICHRLDGIPLAIELAAARVNVFSIEQIAAKLEESLGLLADGNRTALPRQQTIRSSIEWSWNLLEGDEQSLLRRLSVFVGGWTLEAAEEVCSGEGVEAAQVTGLMARLVEKSLVRVEPASGKENRYTLHDMICEFAAEKMDSGEAEITRDRHLQYFLGFSELAEPALHGPDQLAWLNLLRDELDNLRSALSWAARMDIEAGMLIIGRLYGELDSNEALRWSAEFTVQPESHSFPQARAWALLAQANSQWFLEQFEAARLAADKSLALFRQCKDLVGEFKCLLIIGSIVEHREGMEQKVEYQGKALELARSLGDVRRQADALSILAWDWRDPQRAREYREEAIRLYRQVGDWRALAFELSLYGDVLMEIGEVQAAQPLLEEALELNRQLNFKAGMEFVLIARNRQALLKRDYAGARAALQEWLTLALELGNRVGYLYGCARLGQVSLAEGKLAEGNQILKETCLEFQKDENLTGLVFTLERLAHYYFLAKVPDKSVRLYGWADGVRTRIGFSAINKIVRVEIAHDLEGCKAQLGKPGFKKAYQVGQEMTLEEAVRLALE